jgi:hypothetical protein
VRRLLQRGGRPRFFSLPPVRRAASCLPVLAFLFLQASGPGAAPAYAASQAPGGCTGVTLAVIPAQGAITNTAGTEGGHLWWRDTAGGTCVGTVVENVQFTAAAPGRTLRVIIYDTAEPGGLTVAKLPVTAAPGQVSRAFGIHQVFPGLTAVCLAATSPVVPSPDMPCVNFGQPAPPPQFTQPDVQQQAATWLQLPAAWLQQQPPVAWWP